MDRNQEKKHGGANETEEKRGWAYVHDLFRRFCRAASVALGTQWAFLGALLLIIIWAATGPLAGFSDTWQLIINTGTTIITFLMVFLIQNTQNRDGRAVQLKLDELIHSTGKARNRLVDLEDCTDEELDQLEEEFKRVRERQAARRQEHHEHAPRPNASEAKPPVNPAANPPAEVAQAPR